MAAFCILARAWPKMPIRILFNSDGEFVIRDAAAVLASAASSLTGTPDAKKDMIKFLVDNCWEGTDAIVEAAMNVGFDPQDAEEKSAGDGVRGQGDGGRGPGGPRLADTRFTARGHRTLRRSGTDEELLALQRQDKLQTLKLAVINRTAQMAAASTPTQATSTNPPEPNWRQKTKENIGAQVRGALVATLPFAALNEQSLSSGSGDEWVPSSYTNCGSASWDTSVDEASASRTARFQGNVTKDSPQSEQKKVLWGDPDQKKFVKSPQDDQFRAAKQAEQDNETWTSTSVWRGAEGDGQVYHPEKSVTTMGWFHGGWTEGGQGAMMPVVEQDNTFGQPPLMAHCAEQGQAVNAVKSLPGIDWYGKFENLAYPTAKPKQDLMLSEAAAASWKTTNWHSGWHGSHSTTTPVSGGFPGYTSENSWRAPWEERGTVTAEASAPQCGEVKAATNWHSGWHGSNSTTTPVSGGFPGYTSAKSWGAPWEEKGTVRAEASAPQCVEVTTEANCTLQDARLNTSQKKEAEKHEVSRVNVCNCMCGGSAWCTCHMFAMFLSKLHGCSTWSIKPTCVM
jgi:hypothetical protein